MTEHGTMKADEPLQVVLKTGPLGVVKVRNRIIEWMNERLCNVLGYAPEELRGKSTRQLYQNDEEYLRLGEVLYRDGQAETKIQTKDRRLIDLVLWASPMDDDSHIVAVADVTKQKRAENMLRLTQLSVDNAFDPIVWIGRRGEIIYVNAAACKAVDYTREELLAMTVFDIDQELTREKWDELWDLRKARGGLLKERTSRHKDGHLFPVEISTKCLRYEDSEYVVATIRDITERKRAETRLRESEELYRIAMENSNDAVVITRNNRRIYVNRKFGEMHGYSNAEDMLSTPAFERVHPDDADMVEGYHRGRQSGESVPSNYAFRVVRKDGTTIHVEASVATVTYLGEPASLAYLRDVTGRRRSEEALKESEERYRKVVEASPTGILVYMNGEVQFANQAFARMVGVESPEALHKIWPLSFVHPDYLDQAGERMKRIEEERCQVPLMEQKLVRLDGSVIVAEVMGFPFIYRGHEAVMAVMKDVTERVQAREALKKRDEELQIKSDNLEEMNTALKVLLRQREEDKNGLENTILANVRALVLPYVEKLRAGHLSDNQKTCLSIIESSINDIVSPFLQKMTSIYGRFTPTEIQVANLIKSGKTSKEIAALLNVCTGTVDAHRNNIRSKLGLSNKGINLQSHLLSM